MTLIKSISGIRGTIGGHTGDTLNPLDIVKFVTAYATYIRRSGKSSSGKIVVGRDARISGEMVRSVVCGTLMGVGYDVIDIGLATTPTTELAVCMSGADGGIIITASHNPRQWNALKLLNCEGEFLDKAAGNEVLDIAEKEDFEYADVDTLGHYIKDDSFNRRHIDSVLALSLVDVEAVRRHISAYVLMLSTAWEASSCPNCLRHWALITKYLMANLLAILPIIRNRWRRISAV